MNYTRVVGTVHHCPPGEATDVSEVLTERLVGPTSQGMKTSLVRMPFLPPELLLEPSVPHPWGGRGVK
jgi:hypothetical protein